MSKLSMAIDQSRKKKEAGGVIPAASSALDRPDTQIRGRATEEVAPAGTLARAIQSARHERNIRTGQLQQQDNDFNTWLGDVQSFSQRVSGDYSKRQGTYQAPDTFRAYQEKTGSEIADLLKRAYSAKDYYTQFGQAYDKVRGADSTAKLLEGITQNIDYLEGVRANLQGEREWWEQFQDQDEFDEYQRYKGYAELPKADDFMENSQYRSTRKSDEEIKASRGPLSFLVPETGLLDYGDIDYDYINKDPEAMEKRGASDASSGLSALGLDDSERLEMTDDEIAIFNYLYATKSPEEAYRYVKDLTGELNFRQRQRAEEEWGAYASVHPVGASVFSVLTSPVKGISYLGQVADYVSDGEIDQNAGYNKFSYIPSAIRGQVSQDVEKYWVDRGHEFGGKTASFLYQTGMSMGDFLLNAGITGGNQALSLAIMGTGAAADGTISAKDRGLADDQAFALGTIAGLAEVVTEKISLEALLKPDWEKGVLNYIIKNAVAEGSEEVASDAINLVADVLISKDKSEWAQSVQAYMAQGYSEAEATGLAVKDQALAMGVDFLGGALSGGIMSGVAGAGQVAANYRTGRQIGGMNLSVEEIQAFIDEGLASDPSTQAYKLATMAQQKLAAGEKLSDYELGNLYRANVRAVSMEEDGAELLKRAAAEVAEGRRMSNREAKAILESPSAMRTLTEETGLELTEGMSKSQQRSAVREAIARYQTGGETTQIQAEVSAGEGEVNRQAFGSLPKNAAEQLHNTMSVERAAQHLGDQGAKTAMEFYDDTMTPESYYGSFAAYYQAGVTGLDIGKVKTNYAAGLNDATKQAAYLAGQVDAANSLKAEQSRVKLATVYGKEAGLIENDYAKALPREEAAYINNLAKAAGAKISIVEELENGADGRILANGVIELSAKAKNPLLVVAGHEITHRIQQLAPEQYRAYRDYANRVVSERVGRQAVEEIRDRYAQSGVVLNTEQAMDEVAAEFTEAMVKDGKLFTDLAKENRSVARKVLDAIKDFVAKVKAAFKGNTAAQNSAAMEQYGVDMKTLEEAAKLWNDALKAAGEQTARETENAAQEGGEARYSINESFEKDLLEWYRDGQPEGERFILGSTGPVLQGLGAIESDIFMDGDKISKILQDHKEMTIREIQNIPDILEDPVLILKSKGIDRAGENSRLVIFGSVRAQDGRPIMCVLDLRPTEGGFVLSDMQKVNSAYTKNFNPMEFISTSDVLYADKNRTIRALRSAGFNDPVSLTLTRSGSVGSITYRGKNVNIQGVPFSSVVETEGDRGADVRYSQKGGKRTDSFAALQQENAELKGMLAEYRDLQRKNKELTKSRDYWMGQVKRSDGATTDSKAVAQTARELVKKYSARLDVKKVTGDLQSLYDGIAAGEMDAKEPWRRAEAIAREIATNAVEVNDETYRDFKELREYLRTANVVFGKESQGDIPDFNDFRKRLFGKLNIKTGGQTNVDQVYKELSEMWPGLFNEAEVNHPSDQLLHIADVLDMIYTVTEENPFSYNMEEVIGGITNEILDRFFELPQTRETFADRQAKKQERIYAAGKEALAREQEARKAQVKKVKEHYENQRRLQTNLRADSAARTRLLNIARRLKNKKLPAVSRALIDQYIGELDTVAKSMTDRTLRDLQNMREWYKDRKVNDPDFISDPDIEEDLERLSRKQIADLTADEVADLTRVLLHIEHELRTEKKLIDSLEKKTVYNAGTSVIMNIRSSAGSKSTGLLGMVDKYIVTETLSPLREIRRLTGYVKGDPLVTLMEEMAAGQRTMMDYQMKAEKQFQRFAEDKAFNEMFAGKKADVIVISGLTSEGIQTVEITPAMRASLYLHSLNDQNLRHIQEGGITVPDMELYRKGKLEEAYDRGTTIKLTPSQVRNITSKMTEKEKAFARAVHKYFNGTSREAINATSEKLKGYPIAEVENYYPINTDKSFTRADFEALKFDGTIEGMGWTKERKTRAANPIMLRDMTAVLEQAIQQHGKYVGLAIPVRNFNKVWGVTTMSFNDDGSRNSYESSVQQALKKQWGSTAYKYIENLMSDIQTGHRATKAWAKALAKVRSNYAGAVLTLNASVAMKQAASYPTAAAVLGWKPLARAMSDVGKVDLDLIAKYTPLQWYRSKGFSTKELGDVANSSSSGVKALDWIRGKDLPKALNWVQGVDVITTRKLWKASEYYVREHNKGLNVGTDAYYKAVAEVYNRVIEETQPNYTTMQRPQLLRSDDSLMANLSMFKTQPFQNFGIVYDAAGELVAAMKRGNVAEIETARGKFGRAVTSQLAQLAVFAGMTMAWAMFRGKRDKYEDEDGEMSFQSVLAALGKDMAGGAFASVPFGSDAWEAISSKLFGDAYYGMDAVTVEALTNTIESMGKMGDLLGEVLQSVAAGKKVNWNSARIKMDGYLDDISKVAGVPYENVINLFNATYLHVCVATLGKYRGEYAALKRTVDPVSKSATYYDLLYKAMKENRKEYEAIYQDMVDSGDFTAEKIKNAMETRMKKEQSVESVADLEQRYMTPEQEQIYNSFFGKVSGTEVWQSAGTDQREKAEDLLYELAIGSKTGEKHQAKIDSGAAYGIDETDYVLYQLALSMVDKPTESGKMGTYTNEEVEEAIRMLTGLSDEARGYLWDAQGKSEKNNPWW